MRALWLPWESGWWWAFEKRHSLLRPFAKPAGPASSFPNDEDAEKDGDARIMAECGEDYLYSVDYFLLVDLPHDVVATLDLSFTRTTQQPG